MWWDDLSGAELRSRLRNRAGEHEDRDEVERFIAALVRHRDHCRNCRRTIDRIIGSRH